MPAIKIDSLKFGVRRHFWTPRTEILKDVSLQVEPGEIFGFLGPNGAGKTTTIKAMLNLLRPDAGTIELLGGAPSELSVRRRVGFMPEHAYFPEHLSARELLLEHGVLAGLGLAAAKHRGAEILARVGLSDAADKRLGTYSKGMLQRAGLGQALVGDPELVILDEPMSGLDPIGRRDIREIMIELRSQGKTVFFSTHILPDVEMVCDRVGIIVKGRLRKVGRLQDLVGDAVEGVEISTEKCDDSTRQTMQAAGGSVVQRGSSLVLRLTSIDEANRALDTLREKGVVIRSMQVRNRTLEDLFVEQATSTEAEESP